MTATHRGNGTPAPAARNNSGDNPVTRLLAFGESALVFVIAVALLAVAVALLGLLIADFVRSNLPVATRLVSVFDGLLLVVIVLEVYATIRVHLEGAGFQLEPFLVIGVIAIVRHMLSVGAKTVFNAETQAESQALLIDLSVSSGVLLVLVVALALARWSNRWSNST